MRMGDIGTVSTGPTGFGAGAGPGTGAGTDAGAAAAGGALLSTRRSTAWVA
jgi:hypothetical protein